ncbi:MAG: hypothetical protein ACRD3E_04020, partial [Terriglobales bacterium]
QLETLVAPSLSPSSGDRMGQLPRLTTTVSDDRVAALEQEITDLRRRVGELEQQLESFRRQFE